MALSVRCQISWPATILRRGKSRRFNIICQFPAWFIHTALRVYFLATPPALPTLVAKKLLTIIIGNNLLFYFVFFFIKRHSLKILLRSFCNEFNKRGQLGNPIFLFNDICTIVMQNLQCTRKKNRYQYISNSFFLIIDIGRCIDRKKSI